MKKITLSLLAFAISFSFAQSPVQIHGHRGARGLAPENTIPAFIEAIKYGVDYLELDVVITKDSQVLVSHEPWLRTEICENIKSSNPKDYNIFKLTAAEVQAYDCGSKYYPGFPQQQKLKVSKPLLREVIDSVSIYCAKNKLKLPKFNIEIKYHESKETDFQPEIKTFVRLVYDLLKAKDFLKNTLIQSFDFEVLRELHILDSSIPQALLIANVKSIGENVRTLGYTPYAYSPYYKLVNKRAVKTCHDIGMAIVPWTVNSAAKMKKLQQWGVDGIITDYPNLTATLKK